MNDTPSSALDRISGAAIAVVWVGVLVRTLGGSESAVPATLAALALYLALQAGRLSRTGWLHLSVGAAVAGLVIARLEVPGPALVHALERAAFLAALFSALGALREAARTSPTVLATGRMLASQPPGRRYAAMTLGGTFFGAILNFGAIALLGGMVRDANTLEAAGGDARIRAIREKRMLLAILRGFSALMFWCPLTVAYAIVTTTVVGVSWPLMAGFGLIGTAGLLTIGWAVDRLTMPRPRRRAEPQPFAWGRLAPLVGLLALVFALSLLAEETTAGKLIHGVILVVPPIALGWLALGRGARGALGRMGGYLSRTVPTQRGEIAVLGNAAFLGAAVAALLPDSGVQSVLGAALPAVAVPMLVPWVVALLGQAGANPLITVTVLAAAVAEPARLGLDPTVFGLSLVAGWSMTVGSSPAAAATMMTGRMAELSAGEIGRRWNALHTLLGLCFCSAFLGAVHLVW